MTLLDMLTNSFGVPRAYDGRYCLWTNKGPFDIRDIARQLKTTSDAVTDCLPDFKPARRGRAVEAETEEAE